MCNLAVAIWKPLALQGLILRATLMMHATQHRRPERTELVKGKEACCSGAVAGSPAPALTHRQSYWQR